MKGESVVDHMWLHRGTRISAIAAMTTTGILAVELMKGSVKGDRLFDIKVSFQRCYHLMPGIQNPMQ